MKLRNKKTGEILGDLGSFIIQNPNRINCEAITKYDSLAELNAEWEDVPKEPKEYWFINSLGEAIRPSDTTDWVPEDVAYHKEIGNHFSSREEAEKAVEKLKAWKRLEDKGIKATSSNICGDDFVANFKLPNHADYSQSIDDFDCILDLGGEE